MMLRVTALMGAILLSACGSTKSAEATSCDAPSKALSYATDVASVLQTNCTRCHSSTATNRRGAPASINYDTYEAAKANAAEGASQVSRGLMPDDNPSSISKADGCTLVNWAATGAAP